MERNHVTVSLSSIQAMPVMRSDVKYLNTCIVFEHSNSL